MSWEWRCFFNVDISKVANDTELETIWKDQLCTLFFLGKSTKSNHKITFVDDPQRTDLYANLHEADYGLKCRGVSKNQKSQDIPYEVEIKVREKTITGGIEKYTKYVLEHQTMYNRQSPRTSIDFLSLLLPAPKSHNQKNHHDVPPNDVLDTVSSILKTLEHKNEIVIACTKKRILASCHGVDNEDSTVELTKCTFTQNHTDTSSWWSIAISSNNKSHVIDFAKITSDVVLNNYTLGTVYCQGYPEFLFCFMTV